MIRVNIQIIRIINVRIIRVNLYFVGATLVVARTLVVVRLDRVGKPELRAGMKPAPTGDNY